MENQNKHKLSWNAPEFRHYEKNVGWYLTLVSIASLIAAFFFIQKDIFAGITIIILAIIIFWFSRQKPEIIPIELDHKGVRYGNIEFPYKQLKHFWVVHNEKHKTINLQTTTYINNLIILELEGQNPEEIRKFLLKYLPEHPENEQETFTQKIIHWLKF